MSSIDPIDGLPLDLDAELQRLTEERQREEAEDRAETEHLFAGEWMSTADAVAALQDRGSTREEAIGSIRTWLISNDGQRPHLRARAEQATRLFGGPRHKDPEIRRDRIVHGWEWDAEILLADWGGGTFRLCEQAINETGYESELRLIGVRFSRDDFLNRLSPGESAGTQPTRLSAADQKRLSRTSKEWIDWVAGYRAQHSPLPDVDRKILIDAKQAFGSRVTQAMVREAFGGSPPGPRING